MTTNVLPTTNPLPGSPSQSPGQTRPSSPKPEIESSRDLSRGKASLSTRIRTVLDQEVDNKRVDWVSIYACLLTGFTASISFSVSPLHHSRQALMIGMFHMVWIPDVRHFHYNTKTGLMDRGNLAQLGLAIARTFAPDRYSTSGFQLPDIQALVSLLSFLVGASLGRFEVLFGGGKRKSWLVTATFVQCLLAAAAAIAHHYSGEVGVAMYVVPFS